MIIYKTEKEIQEMRKSSQIVAKILHELKKMIKPGIKTKELDRYAEFRAKEFGAVPAFKGYRGYPASLCVSLNNEIIHGIPSNREIRAGDIVSLDFGVFYNGFYGDAALTVPVGEVSEEALNLIAAAEAAFFEGLKKLKVGNHLTDISNAIQKSVESQGFSVIRNFVGHGIGFSLHEDPQVPNFGPPGQGPKLKPGIVLAIEPMIAAGSWEVKILEDNWTAVTVDGNLSSHYEHTVALTEKGIMILSQLEEEEVILKEKGERYA